MAKLKPSHNMSNRWNWERRKRKLKINDETVISYKLTPKELEEYLKDIDKREVVRVL
ncbi:MAG: hypothetical protein SPJ17_05500 [Anaeroplasma sp.]|uniref:hypothetical protein n=1 Tax=Anaeroplasma sp. TaxID=1872523 RepID=UPI002A91F05D|nr:hypothetical protein [Anaeroplasma sp.]MDY5983132.1 hypothetical protein [Anaeroplasma sp.]